MNEKPITLDVREDIRNGREPFSRIMTAVAKLAPGQDLMVVAPFEPVPLYGVMKQQGFQHSTRTVESGGWEVRFTRVREAAASTSAPVRPPCPMAPTGVSRSLPDEMLDVDARGLEPPQPMVKILETVATLPEGVGLRARTDRRPLHLYPQLEQRGFTASTEEQPDGSFLTHIRRA
jgi:uncharacterized protein (DUF2249 family)